MKKKILNIIKTFFLSLIILLNLNAYSYGNNEIIINMSNEPGTLDWNLATDSSSFLIINNIMGGLTKLDSELRLKNNLAEEWYFIEDTSEIIFKIKKNIFWSDGVGLQAQHFKDSWERLLTPSTAADYAYFLFDIKNAKKYNSGSLKQFSDVGIIILDKYTIKIVLEKKKSYFPSLMSFMSTFPIRKDLIKKYGESWTRKENIVTLGEFKLKDKKNNSFMTFENKKGKKIKIIINENSTSSLAMFENNQIDILDGGGIPLLEIPYLKSKGLIRTSNQFRNNYIGFDVTSWPFNDSEIRKAFLYSIEKEVFELILQQTVKATDSWIPEGMLGNRSFINKFNPKKAKEILEKKGFYKTYKNKKITFLFPESSHNRLIAETLQSMWKENINIDVEIQGLEWKVYLAALDSDRPNMYRAGWSADYPDPHNFMNLFTCKSGNNETGWCNNEYDTLISKASIEDNPEKRAKYYSYAQTILLDNDCVIMPMFESNQIFLKSKRIKNFNYSKLGIIDFSDLEIRD